MARPSDTTDKPMELKQIFETIEAAQRKFDTDKQTRRGALQTLEAELSAAELEHKRLLQAKKDLDQELEEIEQRKEGIVQKRNKAEQEYGQTVKEAKEFSSTIRKLVSQPDKEVSQPDKENVPRARGKRAASSQSLPAAPVRSKRPRPSTTGCNEGTIDPIEGHKYIGYWDSHKAWYVVVILPFDGDFERVGILGNITDLPGPIPTCYRTTGPEGPLEWADGFGADGPKMAGRKFPVMAFEDGLDLKKLETVAPKTMFDWIPIADLRPFAREGPDGEYVEGLKCSDSHFESLKCRKQATIGKSSTQALPTLMTPTGNTRSRESISSHVSTIPDHPHTPEQSPAVVVES